MSRYTECIDIIRNDVYGKNVRQAIADALSGVDTGLPDMTRYYEALLQKYDARAAIPLGAGHISYQLIRGNDYLVIATSSQ